ALSSALAQAPAPFRERPAYQVANALNEQGVAAEYGDLLANFAKGSVLERDALQRVGAALGCRYVLLPGVAAFTQTVADRFEIAGIKLVRNQATILRLWLELWDAQTGALLWESAGEITTTSEVLAAGRSVPLDDVAAKLWLAMIKDGLLTSPASPGSPSSR